MVCARAGCAPEWLLRLHRHAAQCAWLCEVVWQTICTLPCSTEHGVPGTQASCIVCAAGLMWDNMQGERWFERLPDTTGVGAPPDTPAARLQRHVTDWEVRPVAGSTCLYSGPCVSGSQHQ